jgi:hypothetical protein
MLATVPSSHAAQFWTEPATCIDGSKTCIDVHMKGEIVKGDAARFNKAVAKVPKGKATIYLDSMGGEFLEGFPIAKTVRRQNWNTHVDWICNSMCAIIWLAGNVRYLRPTAGVGFHGISMDAPKGSTAGIIWRGKRVVRNAVDNALVLKFFQEIGISAKASRILLAPDANHLTVVSVHESMDIKLTPWPDVWPKEDVVTVPATPAPQPAASAPPSPQASTSPQQPAPQTATAPLIKPKITDRVGQPSDQVAPVAQRVVLYGEDPSDPKGKQYVGSVVWRTEPIKASGNQPADIAVRADIEVPDRKFKMTMSFRRNTDTSLPASHTVELTFILPPDFAGGGVSNVPGILMKSDEQARATPLAGLTVKVIDGFFMVGLSNVDADRSRNIQLLKERSWFDVPLVYANHRRAIIAIEKGLPGERAFANAALFAQVPEGDALAHAPAPATAPRQQPPTQQSAPGNSILGVLPASSLPPASVAPQ